MRKATKTALWTVFPIAAGLVWTAAGVAAQSRTSGGWKQKDTEWASYAADVRGSRYRPLAATPAGTETGL
jgi:hypothetical protein